MVSVAKNDVVAIPQLMDDRFTWTEFGAKHLDRRVTRAIEAMKHSHPMLVQSQCIPIALQGKDILIRARTGAGKTLAFVVPMVNKLLLEAEREGVAQQLGGVILVPSSELCVQVESVVKQMLAFCYDVLNCEKLVPGTKYLKSELPNILVTTPGALLTLLKQRKQKLASLLKMLVMDEADLMFSYGYESDISSICKDLPSVYQAVLTSATLNEDVNRLKGLMLHKPAIVKLEDAPNASKLNQFYLPTVKKDKELILYALLKLKLVTGKVLIFVANTDRAYAVKLMLERFSIPAGVLCSEMPYQSRQNVIQSFNQSLLELLIATDHAVDKDDDHPEGKIEEVMDDNEDESDEATSDEDEDEEEEEEEEVAEPVKKKAKVTKSDNDVEEDDDESGEEFDTAMMNSDDEGEDDEAHFGGTDGQKAPHELSDSDAEDDEDEKAALAEFEGEKNDGEVVEGSDDEDEDEQEEEDEAVGLDDDDSEAEEEEQAASSSSHKMSKKERKKNQSKDQFFSASRGLDLRDVETVINYDMPRSCKSYIHRIGRTARGGANGTALSFIDAAVDMEMFERLVTKHIPVEQMQKLELSLKDIQTFRYRVDDVMTAINPKTIAKMRLRDIQNEAVMSSNLKAHFEENPDDLRALRMSTASLKGKHWVKSSLKSIPTYLMPPQIVANDPIQIAIQQQDAQAKGKKRKRNEQGRKNPLVNMAAAVHGGKDRRKYTRESQMQRAKLQQKHNPDVDAEQVITTTRRKIWAMNHGKPTSKKGKMGPHERKRARKFAQNAPRR